jgi:type IV secretory pathway component VirB8
MTFWKRKLKGEERDDGNDKNPADSSSHEEAVTWESSRIDSALKSERMAWKVAGCSVSMAALLVVALIVLMPLKETVPYVVRVDALGAADIITTLKDKPMSYDDVIDKYWLSKYVRAYESWEYYTAQEDYDFVGLTSSATVAKNYALLFEGPRALDKQYGEKTVVKTQIVSVTPAANGSATVRFEKKMLARTAPENQNPSTKWIATIGYEYKKISKMKEKERLVNPLGFHVTSYRVDPEMIAAPPPLMDLGAEQKAPVVPAIEGYQGGQK